MKTLAELKLPSDRRYTDQHIWAKQVNDTFLIGISDFAQDQLGEIMYIDLPSIGDNFISSADFGTVESLKSVNKLYMPFDGEVVELNSLLEDTPSLINLDCYEKAWIIRIKAKNNTDYQKMLSFESYKASIA